MSSARLAQPAGPAWNRRSSAGQRAASEGLLVLLVTLLGWCASCRVARAEGRTRLIWQRPVDSMCPSAATLESDVAELLGRPVFSADDDADVIIEGAVEDTDAGAFVHIRAHTRDGEELGTRELTAAAGECASLRRPLGLVLTLMFERDAERSVGRAPQAHPWRVGALLAGQSGTLPRITPGVGLAFAITMLPRLELHADASYWAPVRAETSAGLGARFQGVSAGLALCPQLTRAQKPLAVSACLGAALGGLLATPRKLRDDAVRTRLSAQALVTLRVWGRVQRALVLEGALGPALSLTRPRFFLTRSDGAPLDVHRPALFGAFLSLTLFFSPKSS